MPWIIFHWGTWREFIANKCAKLSLLKAGDFRRTLARATVAAVHTRSICQFKVCNLLLLTPPCWKLSTKTKSTYIKFISLELISRSQHSYRSISVLELFRHTDTVSYDILEHSNPATAKTSRVLLAGGCSGKTSGSSNTKQQLWKNTYKRTALN